MGCKEKLASRSFCCGHWLRGVSEAQSLAGLKVRFRLERESQELQLQWDWEGMDNWKCKLQGEFGCQKFLVWPDEF